MNKPHKHAELIKAWADGKQIQFRNTPNGEWRDVTSSYPSWTSDFYRIKPEAKPDMVFHAQIDNYKYGQSYNNITLNMLAQTLSEQDNIRLVFDGETGKLKAVELLEQK